MSSVSSLLQLPDGFQIAQSLVERHSLSKRDQLEVTASIDQAQSPTLKLNLTRRASKFLPREEYEIEIAQNNKTESWDGIIDALDALLAGLVESDFNHRALPVGHDMAYGQDLFDVRSAYLRPELETAADQILNGN